MLILKAPNVSAELDCWRNCCDNPPSVSSLYKGEFDDECLRYLYLQVIAAMIKIAISDDFSRNVDYLHQIGADRCGGVILSKRFVSWTKTKVSYQSKGLNNTDLVSYI